MGQLDPQKKQVRGLKGIRLQLIDYDEDGDLDLILTSDYAGTKIDILIVDATGVHDLPLRIE